ncbi:hypothetical protein SCLCIDRAFT_21280 [Scleroderma citrinum Foug A]|uniref:Uncharacterized protein n=1 Tax=Scleroderma citrinum Foug A TaxID=1036808 RepID=A0A0C3EHI3_9AGAM|nr:hypothetical protein SCLCIDRAFT_21280 [Scleroderma citrinum Foug A]
MCGHPCPTPTIALSPVTVSAPTIPVLSTPAVASSSTQSLSAPARPDKGKGRQQTASPPPTAGPVDPSPSATPLTTLTPEQHLCLVQVLKRLNEWLSHGWEPGVDQSRLWSLAEIFNSTEAVAEGGIANLHLADLTWRLADSEGWGKSAGSSIMGAIDIQVTITKILYKDYADALAMYQDRLFRRRQVIEIRNQSFRRGFDSKAWMSQMEKLALFARKGMREADYLLTRRTPAYLRMMRHAGALPDISPLLAERLTGSGGISYSLSDSPLLELMPSAPPTPRILSLTRRLLPSPEEVTYDTNSQVVVPLPMTTPLADIGVSSATPSVTGPPTMTEVVDQFMEDLLTQEFCPILLDEDI